MKKIAHSIMALSVALGGCGARDDDNATAEQAYDSTAAVYGEAALFMAASYHLPTGASKRASASASASDPVSEFCATTAASVAAELYSPEGCVTATADGTVVTYVFENCTGPYGIAELNGTLAITFKVEGGVIKMSAVATDLAVNNATIDIEATASYRNPGGGTFELSISTAGTATGPLGRSIERSGNYDVSWDDRGCAYLDG
ncbi:MAG: hypothetical protein V2A73_09940, partial [Pseudomonadota bacterium]